jgi:hypothetical protein
MAAPVRASARSSHSISPISAGLVQAFGPTAGFLAITAVACAATGLISVFIAETKPADYEK